MSKQVLDYFAEVQISLNYLGSTDGHKAISEVLEKGKFSQVVNYEKAADDGSDIVVYAYENNEGQKRYCAELSYRTGVDDYNIEKHIFSSVPSLENIQTIRFIQSARADIKLGKLEVDFNCSKCGRKIHFLDLEGNLLDKKRLFQNRHCGC